MWYPKIKDKEWRYCNDNIIFYQASWFELLPRICFYGASSPSDINKMTCIEFAWLCWGVYIYI